MDIPVFLENREGKKVRISVDSLQRLLEPKWEKLYFKPRHPVPNPHLPTFRGNLRMLYEDFGPLVTTPPPTPKPAAAPVEVMGSSPRPAGTALPPAPAIPPAPALPPDDIGTDAASPTTTMTLAATADKPEKKKADKKKKRQPRPGAGKASEEQKKQMADTKKQMADTKKQMADTKKQMADKRMAENKPMPGDVEEGEDGEESDEGVEKGATSQASVAAVGIPATATATAVDSPGPDRPCVPSHPMPTAAAAATSAPSVPPTSAQTPHGTSLCFRSPSDACGALLAAPQGRGPAPHRQGGRLRHPHETVPTSRDHQPSDSPPFVQFLAALMSDFKAEVTAEMAGLKAEVKAEMAGLKAEMAGLKADVVGLKADVAGLKADVVGLKAETDDLKKAVYNLTQGQGAPALPHVDSLPDGAIHTSDTKDHAELAFDHWTKAHGYSLEDSEVELL
ncbi:hypothetical protein PAPYR_10178 [Paratrimastix pyriformis]|uniref:Uncharacterized protein n=1 Tax=Paratrimastix pyriformis TaxID=342808 RepID=A0ABQ8U6P7_9EUKA|nr:hypothetical protein PAPYR_10178 [Paratrimastix pyriformis]